MLLKLVHWTNQVLHQECAPVEKITPEIIDLIRDMLDTMRASGGIGLAANQVGMAVRIAVIDVGEPVDVKKHMPLVLINPVVTPYGDRVCASEGCLSLPGIYAGITRPETVNVIAMNAKGKTSEFRFGGLLARVVQHENDHLNGLMIIDRLIEQSNHEPAHNPII